MFSVHIKYVRVKAKFFEFNTVFTHLFYAIIKTSNMQYHFKYRPLPIGFLI